MFSPRGPCTSFQSIVKYGSRLPGAYVDAASTVEARSSRGARIAAALNVRIARGLPGPWFLQRGIHADGFMPAALSGVVSLWYDRCAMARLPELIGRAMIDPDFLADLQRSPEPILAQYELTADERSIVLR